MKRWHLVHCKPRQEDKAQINLERQAYQTYLPKLCHTSQPGGKRLQIIEPLFPRYLFIQLDNVNDNWAPIRSTVGVTSLVRFGETPAVVPDEIIAYLRGRENDYGLHFLVTPPIEPGSKVRIVKGPMQGYEAIFLAKSGRDRVAILLNILGEQTRVETREDYIEPCG